MESVAWEKGFVDTSLRGFARSRSPGQFRFRLFFRPLWSFRQRGPIDRGIHFAESVQRSKMSLRNSIVKGLGSGLVVGSVGS